MHTLQKTKTLTTGLAGASLVLSIYVGVLTPLPIILVAATYHTSPTMSA